MRATTLIELLITLAVLTLALFFISPAIFTLPNNIKISQEADLFKSFIYQVQHKARQHKEKYALFLAKTEDKWCAIALKKAFNNTASCNCLNYHTCDLSQGYYLYQNQFNSRVETALFFPTVFLNIEGVSGRLESKCLNIQLANEKRIIQFDKYGAINVLEEAKRSGCN